VNAPGRRAELPPYDHRRPQALSSDSLVVRHRNSRGQIKEFDFSTLTVAEPFQRSLATLFAARCVPEGWTTHVSSSKYWRHVVYFVEFLCAQPETVRDLDELSAAMLRRWRNSLPLHDKRRFTRMAYLLREDPRLRSGPVADELLRRVRLPPSSTQSYSDQDFTRIKVAARRTFRTARKRIDANAAHLQRWHAGAFAESSQEWLLGEALDVLARTGLVPEQRKPNAMASEGFLYVAADKYQKALGGAKAEFTWQRLFLSRMEATALAVLLMAEFGWNLSVIADLKVPKASPDQGVHGQPTYRLELDKPRRGPGHHHETRNVTDTGADSAGRLITHALQATRFARMCVAQIAPQADRLMVWRTGHRGPLKVHADREQPAGVFRFGVLSQDATTWAQSQGFTGSPFLRGRRTVIAVNRREPAQQSEQTFDRSYVLVDHRVQRDSVDVIAEGAEAALTHARGAVLVAALRDNGDPHDVETATADCADPYASPFSNSAELGCTASFLLCLACTNAHVHPGHHSRLAHLEAALTNLRSALPPAVWRRDWAEHHARLEDLRTRLGDAVWGRALARVTDADRDLIDHLLHGLLEA
jgi:hypothetical protein